MRLHILMAVWLFRSIKETKNSTGKSTKTLFCGVLLFLLLDYTSQGRDLRDWRDEPAPGENYTSVMDCGRFLENVYTGTNVSESAAAEMLNFLGNQTRRNKILAGLPEGVACANKTGELSDTENDVAIVFGDGGPDYIICVMSQDFSDTASAQTGIKKLSGMVYNYFMETTIE